MLFHSTRGKDRDKTFEQVLMQGLAKDGGLYMPNNWPQVDIEKLKNLTCDEHQERANHFIYIYTIVFM